MPFFRVHGLGMVHLKMGGKHQALHCRALESGGVRGMCYDIATHACDGPIGDEGHTVPCNKPLCARHAHQVGKDEHLCPQCLQKRRERQPELPLHDEAAG